MLFKLHIYIFLLILIGTSQVTAEKHNTERLKDRIAIVLI